MVVLPPVVYEQRCSIGKIRHQLQPAITTRVVNETLVNVSPRVGNACGYSNVVAVSY